MSSKAAPSVPAPKLVGGTGSNAAFNDKVSESTNLVSNKLILRVCVVEQTDGSSSVQHDSRKRYIQGLQTRYAVLIMLYSDRRCRANVIGP